MSILAELRREPKGAYDLILFIHKKFHLLMSSGTVYSTLYSMERDGLIQGNSIEGRKVYTLTNKGEKTIRAIIKTFDKIQLFLASLLGNLT